MSWYLDKSWYGLDGTNIYKAIRDLCNALAERQQAIGGVYTTNFYVNLNRESKSQLVGTKQAPLDLEDLIGLEFRYLAANTLSVLAGIRQLVTKAPFQQPGMIAYLKSSSRTGEVVDDYITEAWAITQIGDNPLLGIHPYSINLFQMTEFMIWLADYLSLFRYFILSYSFTTLENYGRPNPSISGGRASCDPPGDSGRDLHFDFDTYLFPTYFGTFRYTCPATFPASAGEAWDGKAGTRRDAGATLSPPNTNTSDIYCAMAGGNGTYLEHLSGPFYLDSHILSTDYSVYGNTTIKYEVEPDRLGIQGTVVASYISVGIHAAGCSNVSGTFGGSSVSFSFPAFTNFITPNGPSQFHLFASKQVDNGVFDKTGPKEVLFIIPPAESNPFSGVYHGAHVVVTSAYAPYGVLFEYDKLSTGIGSYLVFGYSTIPFREKYAGDFEYT